MKCSECGATLKQISSKCSECGAVLEKKSKTTVTTPAPAFAATPAFSGKRPEQPKRPSLIEFPGINRSALPEWRKELSERVREKQERRAREAMLEEPNAAPTSVEAAPVTGPLLELLPQTQLPPMNPIVEAALKRIERAHLNSPSFSHGHAALATAVAYQEAPAREQDRFVAPPVRESDGDAIAEAKPAEKTHNLAVVRNPALVGKESNEPAIKPKRLIGETNDPALNYLDAVPTALLVENRQYETAPVPQRLFAALLDLLIVGALASPLLALESFSELDWTSWRVLSFTVGGTMLLAFLYLTIVTAFTGRTVGMRLCSLRVIDARNGLIPSGGQSAGRALLYMVSLTSAGLLFFYVFLDSERTTLHDHVTRTAVIRT